MSNRVWVTWETQRRNFTLSEKVGARLYVFEIKTGNRLIRYARCLWNTACMLRDEKPEIIFAQNPSLVLSLFSVLYGRAFKLPVIIDAHNAGLFPLEGKSKIATYFSEFITRTARYTIVSNDRLAELVEFRKGSPIVLPDPIPDFHTEETEYYKLPTRFNVLYICSFSADEPYEEVIQAAEGFEEDIKIYISGNYKKVRGLSKKSIPGNVIFTGFMSEERYIGMLHSVDIAMVLTKRDDCLLCGAYESVSMEKPFITTNKIVLREYFSRGVIYTDNTPEDIRNKILYARKNMTFLTESIRHLKLELIQRWETKRKEFNEILTNINNNL